MVRLYALSFGGKPSGKYRISRKSLRVLARHRGLSPDFLRELSPELFELGFVMLDLETLSAVLSRRSFRSIRRVAAARIGTVGGRSPALAPR
ncbi:MAG: hypothetical protein MI785_14805 [Kiloniellales bacterium]|nr:hypothetical protein [Kiloniellales bacterium]